MNLKGVGDRRGVFVQAFLGGDLSARRGVCLGEHHSNAFASRWCELAFDGTFDLVAGFNSFFFAVDMVAALREAGRVGKPDAAVVIQVWGRPDRCDLTAMKQAIAPLVPAPDPDAPAPPPLWEPGVLESIADQAGLKLRSAYDVSWAFEFPDKHTLARAMLAPGLIIELIDAVGEQPVHDAIVEGLEPYRTPSGGYRLMNEWHTLIASAS